MGQPGAERRPLHTTRNVWSLSGSSEVGDGLAPDAQSLLAQIRSDPEVMTTSRAGRPRSRVHAVLPVFVTTTVNDT